MTKETGGNAFPGHTNPRPGQLMDAQQGMTLRDYFAAKAMVQLMADWTLDETCFNSLESLAGTAYEYADAMLEARKVKP